MLILKGDLWQWRIIWLDWLSCWLLEHTNINQRYHDTMERPGLSSLSNRVPFKVEAKVDISTYGGEVDAKKVNIWLK